MQISTKRDVQCHKYICPKSLQGKRAMLGHLKRSAKRSARWENNTKRKFKFGKKHRRKVWRTNHIDPYRDTLEELMEQHNLIDVPPNNGKCTWSNKRVGKSNIKERLDRIMIQENIVAVHSSIK